MTVLHYGVPSFPFYVYMWPSLTDDHLLHFLSERPSSSPQVMVLRSFVDPFLKQLHTVVSSLYQSWSTLEIYISQSPHVPVSLHPHWWRDISSFGNLFIFTYSLKISSHFPILNFVSTHHLVHLGHLHICLWHLYLSTHVHFILLYIDHARFLTLLPYLFSIRALHFFVHILFFASCFQ